MSEEELKVRYTADDRDVMAAQARIRGSLARVESSVTKTAASLQRAGRTLTRNISLPLLAAGVAAIKMSVQFDASMAKIQGLVGLSGDAVAVLRGQVLELAKTLPQSPQQLAEALYQITSSGIPAAQAMEVLTVSAKAASSGLGDTATVADAVTSAMNAYRTSHLSAAQATDILTAAVREGKGEPADLAKAIGYAIPIASEAGVAFREVAAALASATLTGSQAETAAQGLRFLLSSLIKPTSQSAKALAAVGTSAAELRTELREKGLLATLTDLHNRLPTQDFLKVVGGARGAVLALSLVGQNAERVSQVFAGVAGSVGDANRAFDVASQTANFKFRTALSSIQVAAIQLGEKLLPLAAGLTQSLLSLVNVLSKIPPNLFILVAAIGPAVRAFGALMSASALLSVAGLGVAAASAASFLTVLGPMGAALVAVAGSFAFAQTKAEDFSTSLRPHELADFSKGTIASIEALRGFTADGKVTGAEVQKLIAVFDKSQESFRLTGKGVEMLTSAMKSGVRPIGALIYGLSSVTNTAGDVSAWAGSLQTDLAKAFNAGQVTAAEISALSDVFSRQFGVSLDPAAVLNEASALKQAGAAAGAAIPDIEGLANAMQDVKDLSMQLAGGFLGIQGAALSAKGAQLALAQAEAHVKQLLKDGKKGTLEYRQALLDLDQANLGTVESQLSLASAVADYIKQTSADGAPTQREINRIVREYGKMAGLSAGEIKSLMGTVEGLINTYDGVPNAKHTKVTADTGQAEGALKRVVALLATIRAPSNVSVLLHGSITGGTFAQVQHGAILKGPVMLGASTMGGEGSYPTRYGKGAEVVMPLKDSVLADLGSKIAGAMSGGGGPETIILQIDSEDVVRVIRRKQTQRTGGRR